MAQNFLQQGAPVETGLVREYVANLQTNTDTLRSNFSGSTFPATPVAGQHCYRIDMDIEYVYDGQDWKEVPAASSLSAEMKNARGSMPSLWDRLNVAINPDGTLKNPIAAEIDEWKDTAIAPTYVSDNQFSVEGDLTPIFTKGRSVKIFSMDGKTGVISTSGVTTVISSTASNGITIVTVANSIITSDLYDVKYGLFQETVIPQRNSLQRLTVYEVDDIAYTDKLKSYMYLSCTQAGITGATEPLFKSIITPASVGEAHSVTMITTNGGTTGTVTSGGTFTGTSNKTIYVKLSASTPGASETYEMITLSYCVGSQTGTYTEIGLADGEPQEIVDGVTVQLSTTGVFEDGEIYSIACVAEVSEPFEVGNEITDGSVTWKICKFGGGGMSPRQSSTVYKSGDIAYYYGDNFPTGWYLECTTGGTTSSGALTFTSAPSVGSTKTDGTVTWTVRKPANTANIPSLSGYATTNYVNSKAVPAGTITAYGGNSTPSGWLLCDGSAVSRSTYSSLYSAIGTTWGSGNGSTTFNLPNLNSYWLKGSSTAGSSISAGLPNIKGEISEKGAIVGETSTSGALYKSNQVVQYSTSHTTGKVNYPNLGIDASLSNSLYGSSTTVSVSSKTVRFIIKY